MMYHRLTLTAAFLTVFLTSSCTTTPPAEEEKRAELEIRLEYRILEGSFKISFVTPQEGWKGEEVFAAFMETAKGSPNIRKALEVWRSYANNSHVDENVHLKGGFGNSYTKFGKEFSFLGQQPEFLSEGGRGLSPHYREIDIPKWVKISTPLGNSIEVPGAEIREFLWTFTKSQEGMGFSQCNLRGIRGQVHSMMILFFIPAAN